MNDTENTLLVRPPQVAGYFYPGEPEVCEALVTSFVASARDAGITAPKVLIAPHAGYAYSGPIAGSAYKTLLPVADKIERVVLLGPAHYVAFEGLATTSADAWETPLGQVPIDKASIQRLHAVASFNICDKGFANEHSLEVHVPFLQKILPSFTLVPILVGDETPDRISDALEIVWGGPETLIVISSDLSHYHTSETARTLDLKTTHAIETLKSESLGGRDACGYRAIAGALKQARKRDLRVTAIDLRNSADTSGTPDRVVGYGAYAMEYANTAHICEGDRAVLGRAAYDALAEAVATGRAPEPDIGPQTPPALAALRASFVTLTLDGHLRGCIGSVAPHRPLIEDVSANAVRAGFSDRRFPPVSAGELPRLSLEISILSHLRPIAFTDEADLLRQLRPDVDGLLIEARAEAGAIHRALFLPAVWENLSRPADFLHHLKIKAGLPGNYPAEDLRAFRFTVERFGLDNPFAAREEAPLTREDVSGEAEETASLH